MHYLIGLLVGDYIVQDDFMARNKLWSERRWMGLLIALYHALTVTIMIYLAGAIAVRSWHGFWSPWKLIVIWITHALQDWSRVPVWIMNRRKQFIFFRNNMPQAYIWAVIVVDNVWHLTLLFLLAHI
jgi:hypothetical protein